MQYMLLIHSSETAMQTLPQDAIAKMHAAYMAYTDAITQAGVVVNGNRLRPTSAQGWGIGQNQPVRGGPHNDPTPSARFRAREAPGRAPGAT